MSAGPDPRPPLLLTRPRAGSERFARQFRARMGADWPILIAPLMEIDPTGATIPAADTLIFTSEQAIGPVVQAGPRAGVPAFCVGRRTAEAVQAAGFPVIGMAATAEALLAVILAAPDPGRLLHVRGNEIAFALADRLKAAGRDVAEVIVYAQNPRPPGTEMLSLLAGPGPVLLPVFSPNSGRLLCTAAQDAQAALRVAAISPAAAAACAGLPGAQLMVAGTPTAEALLDVLVALS